MKISKIKIKEMFGIKIKEIDIFKKDIEIIGDNGTGKTSIVESIRFALNNESEKKVITRNGAEESEVFVEIDDISIIRRDRPNMESNYIKVQEDKKTVKGSIEGFLRNMYSELQLNPVGFLSLSIKEQNRILLDLIKYEWDMKWIENQFGEIPPKIDYNQNILNVLSQIYAEDGYYYTKRHGINLLIRNKKANIDDIKKTIPVNYNIDDWENKNIGDIYNKINEINNKNNIIEKAKNKLAGINLERENIENKLINKRALLDTEKITEVNKIIDKFTEEEKKEKALIADYLRKIEALKENLKNLKSKKDEDLKFIDEKIQIQIQSIENNFKKDKEDLFIKEREAKKIINENQIESTEKLKKEADFVEEMKGFLNEAKKIDKFNIEIEDLKKSSDDLTLKLEKARTLPAQIIAECKLPIKNFTIEDGEPRINNLPLVNLSDGEKLMFCIDVISATDNNKFKIILLDGLEKLSDNNRAIVYKKCKDLDIQFIATRTTNDKELLVVEI